ncbi:hypothetical protein HY406_00195 [Candidatus Giovannonibacteria bacterium]|nr:hypothetical protein [Candidatus Giovannonibacteria bacterium]
MPTINKKFNWTDGELRDFEQRVMRRVYAVWFLRKVVLPVVLILPVAGFIMVRELSKINLAVIAQNVLARLAVFDLDGFLTYSVGAVRYTQHAGALLVVGSLVLLGVFFARRIIRDVIVFSTQGTGLSPYSSKER